GKAAHGADLDLLLLAEFSCGNAGVDAVGEPLVALALGLDDGSGVDSGGGAEGVLADDRVVHWKLVPGDLRGQLDELAELAHVARAVDGVAEQFEIHQQLIAGGVADALADSCGAAVQAGGACRARRQSVGQGEAAVVVAVPVEADPGTDRLPDPADQGRCSVGRGVADGVAEAETSRACGG